MISEEKLITAWAKSILTDVTVNTDQHKELAPGECFAQIVMVLAGVMPDLPRVRTPIFEIRATARPLDGGLNPWDVTEAICLRVEDAVVSTPLPHLRRQRLTVDGYRATVHTPRIVRGTQRIPGDADDAWAGHSVQIQLPWS